MWRDWMNYALSDFAINILPFHRISTTKFVSHIFFSCTAIFFKYFFFLSPITTLQFFFSRLWVNSLLIWWAFFFFAHSDLFLFFFHALFGLRIYFFLNCLSTFTANFAFTSFVAFEIDRNRGKKLRNCMRYGVWIGAREREREFSATEAEKLSTSDCICK